MSNSGIQGFSKPQVNLVVFSADKIYLANYVTSFLRANQIDHVSMIGSWENEVENSWAIPRNDLPLIDSLIKTQKSLLFLNGTDSHNRRKAELLWNKSGKVDDLGYFCQVSEIEARSRSGWSSFWQDGGKGFKATQLWFTTYQIDKFGQPIKD